MMINEPVIIDDVEVSCCDHYKSNGKCRIPHYQHGIKYTCCNCNEWDCYFKQLARRIQENEELRKKREENTTFYLTKYANKDSECLELQHKISVLTQTLLGIKDIAEENIRIADLEGLNGVYRRGLAKQILQIIKSCKGVEDDNRN